MASARPSGGCLLALGAARTASAPGPVLLAVGVALAGTSAGGVWAPFSDAVANQVPAAGSRRALALVNAGSPGGLMVASALVLAGGESWRLVWLGFAVVGLVAAVTTWRVLAPVPAGPIAARGRLPPGWFLNARSVWLLVVALGVSITSGAYFAYAPDTAEDAGLASGIGPAMWAVLGIAGAAVGVLGGGIANRYGLRGPLAVMLVLVGASALVPPRTSTAASSSTPRSSTPARRRSGKPTKPPDPDGRPRCGRQSPEDPLGLCIVPAHHLSEAA